MSTWLAFTQLGFRHIVDVDAMDHILFLVALAAIYRWRDAKSALWVITAFTIGHSATLALAVTHTLELPPALIEFLIPVTIVATCVENLLAGRWKTARNPYRPVLAGVFGLVHGAGFANYLQSMFVDRIALPLFGFNVGIEAGQIVVLAAASVALALLDGGIEAVRTPTERWPALRVRAVGVSMAIVAIAAHWAWERAPW